MAIHSNVIAWEIPWTEETDRPQSMDFQRVRYDIFTKKQQTLPAGQKVVAANFLYCKITLFPL